MIRSILLCGLALFAAGTLFAEVKLPAIFSDHAVLARRAKVPVWGTAAPGEAVSVKIGEVSGTTTADAQGNWRVDLDLSKSPAGPFDLEVNNKKIRDVAIGEVWLCGGQSNMAFRLLNAFGHAEEKARPADPMLRCFTANHSSPTPLRDCKGAWVAAAPETIGGFSAVAYFFARKLREELDVPVGLLSISCGGSPLETWLPPEAAATIPDAVATQEKCQKGFDTYDERKAKFCAALAEWCEKYQRQDSPMPHPLPPADAQWHAVKSKRISNTPGVAWVRQRVTLVGDEPLLIYTSRPKHAMEFFVNGSSVGALAQGDAFDNGRIVIKVPQKFLKQGVNDVAIRIFSPFAQLSFEGSTRIGNATLRETKWDSYIERTMPLPTDEMLKELPPLGRKPNDVFFLSRLYNGGIAPQVPTALSGVIWYQGEANTDNPALYAKMFPVLIRGWREKFENPELPFYYCQLANYKAKKNHPDEVGWAALREVQTATLAVPHTGQAVLIDVGEADDIHPLDKKTVGDRLAALALAKTYGKSVPCEGPRCKSVKIEGNAIRVTFDAVGGGLVAKPLPATYPLVNARKKNAPLVRNSPDSELEGFALCGEDGKWVWAEAKIDGDTVVVTSAKVPAPKHVRYAWGNNPTCNLYNKEGFPAVPFQSR